MADREIIIDPSSSGTDVGAGIAIALIIVALLIAGGFLVFSNHGSSSSVTLEVPKVTVTTPRS